MSNFLKIEKEYDLPDVKYWNPPSSLKEEEHYLQKVEESQAGSSKKNQWSR